MTCMSKPWARLATARPTRPRPTIPSVLPPSCVPVNLLRSQRPALRLSLALATFRDSASINAIVCSAVETVLPPGVFMTTIPWRVAARTCLVSTPPPAPPAGRGRHGDVVGPPPGADDHLQPRLVPQNVGRQLSARADHDPVRLP